MGSTRVFRFTLLGALSIAAEHASGFDRSQLYSDEGPPIGAVATEPWAEAASEIAAWVVRWS